MVKSATADDRNGVKHWKLAISTRTTPFFFYIRIVAYANYFHIFHVDQTQCSRQWFAQQAGRQLSQLPF